MRDKRPRFHRFCRSDMTIWWRYWWSILFCWCIYCSHSSFEHSVGVSFYPFLRKNDSKLIEIWLSEGNICLFGLLLQTRYDILLDDVFVSSNVTNISSTHVWRILTPWFHPVSSCFVILIDLIDIILFSLKIQRKWPFMHRCDHDVGW